ncbi:MAG: hypothetical protein M1510_00990 [Nitrospirae bacterium]|nr:hypothetical protein [Nitrospirota bacterium]
MKSVIGKIFASIVSLTVLALTACTGAQMVKTAEVSKSTGESILYEARMLQNKGVITDGQFNNIRDMYDLWQPAEKLAIEARIAYLRVKTADNKQKMYLSIEASERLFM